MVRPQGLGRPSSCKRPPPEAASLTRDSGPFADSIEAKLSAFLRRIEASEPYRRVFDSDADPRLILAVVKYVLLEVFSYGPHITEATFTAIGRMPKTRPDLMRVMVRHDLEEVDHG